MQQVFNIKKKVLICLKVFVIRHTEIETNEIYKNVKKNFFLSTIMIMTMSKSCVSEKGRTDRQGRRKRVALLWIIIPPHVAG